MGLERHHIRQKKSQLERYYDLDALKREADYLQRELDDLKEEVKEYLEANYEQEQKVVNTEFEKIVYLERRGYKNISYYVGVRVLPKINLDRRDIFYKTLDSKIYPGKQRHLARMEAIMLSTKHNARIETNVEQWKNLEGGVING